MCSRSEAASSGEEPVALVLRSRTQRLDFLPRLHWQIVVTGVLAVLLATLVAYAIARTVTRPVRALTATMSEMAATGDLARTVPPGGAWDDEDARALAATFRQLTGALDRFQREAAQRERLSSLGRLSTVVAHEIRNPLMIIKSAVRNLRRHASPDVVAVAANIDEEVQRLNHVVTDVLDFARPIRFELAPADLLEICRDAAQAAQAGPGRRADPPSTPAEATAPIVTDAERVRAVLVNVLANAQQAMQSVGATRQPAGPRRSIRGPGGCAATAAGGSRCSDRGPGIAARGPRRDLRAVLHDPPHRLRARPGHRAQYHRGAGRQRSPSTAGVDAGTVVRIELPDRPPASGGIRVTRGSILLVDDEPKIRQALAASAARRGPRRSWRPEVRAKRCGSSTSGRSTCSSWTT